MARRHTGGKETKRTDPVRRALLDGKRRRGSTRAACELAGVGKSFLYQWIREDPDFAEEWEHATDDAVDAMEEEAHRRAVDGYDVPVWHKGKQSGTYKQYSDGLLKMLLAGNRREKYGPAVSVSGGVMFVGLTLVGPQDEKMIDVTPRAKANGKAGGSDG